MRFSMLYSGEQILSFKSCLIFYAGDSLIISFVRKYKGQNMSSQISNILRRYHIFVHFDIQRKML